MDLDCRRRLKIATYPAFMTPLAAEVVQHSALPLTHTGFSGLSGSLGASPVLRPISIQLTTSVAKSDE